MSPSRSPAPLLLALSALFLVFPGCRSSGSTRGSTDGSERPPNLIFVLADDLGYGDLGCYGQEKIRTPRLDALAAGGMRFTDFYAGSTVCAPSRCVLMTGYHTGHAFIRGNGKDNLRPEDLTLAEVLQGAGYATGMFGKWGLGQEGSTGLPTRQGFDEFYGYLDQSHAHNYYPSFLVDGEERVPLTNVVPEEGKWGQGKASEKREYSHDLIVERALAFVDAHGSEPFFLYLPLTIPHANNEARKDGMEVPEHGEYAERDWPEPQKGLAAMITRMDRDVGRLVDRLRAHGLEENTLIVFTSDNGPHREGGNDPDFQDSNGPLNGIKRALTEGGIRVPMIASWPGVIAPGTTSAHVAAFQDVLPTFAAAAGSRALARVPDDTDGISFLPTLRGSGDQAQHDSLYWAFYERGGARALRQGRWKAVQQPIDSSVRLYDLEDDLGEQDDLAALHPLRVHAMVQRMEASCTPSERWTFGRKNR